jgi:hypothetical protein
MPRKHKRQPGSRRYVDYSTETLEKALRDIQHNRMTTRDAAKKYKIPRSTLMNKLHKQHTGKIGGPTKLSAQEESYFVHTVITLSEAGFPLDRCDLCYLVKAYLDRTGKKVRRFKDNLPGEEWTKSFIFRHDELTERFASNIKRKRAQIGPEVLNNYFDHLEKELDGIPPGNIINFDETNLTDDPGSKKILTKRGSK